MNNSTNNPGKSLTRRERQIMDIVYRLGKATANDVREHMPEAPSYSAVRALLRILEEKGHLSHHQDGPRYVFEPTVAAERASVSALERVVSTFFGGSAEKAVAALLELSDADIDEDEYQRLSALIEKARKQGR
jgi:predicted transcriptional regulator